MNNQIIDVHTHCFPDFLAEKAIISLSEHSKPYKPYIDGTITGLIKSMDKASIAKSFIASIATKPEQTDSIINWSKEIHTERIIPLGSIHPKSTNWQHEINLICEAGLPGIKFHPMYQDFYIDDKNMYPIYEYIASEKLFVLFHAGYDIAFQGDLRAKPERIAKIIDDIPGLIIIAAHFGGWKDWIDANICLIGKNVYIDTSFINEISDDIKYKILNNHDNNKILFGTDSPWLNQKNEVENIFRLKIDDDYKERILYKNALRLLKEVNYAIKF